MDLHRFRAQQGSFSPTPSRSPGLSTNPDISVTGSQNTSLSATTTLIYQPNPLIAPRSILKSIPWGKEQNFHFQSQSHSQPDLEQGHELSSSLALPMNSPSYLLSPPPLGAIGGGVNGGLGGIGGLGELGGGNGGMGGGGGGGGGGNGGGGFTYVKSGRRITPYRGFAYTPTRPSTGRLSRLTAADPNRECGVLCWCLFLFACAAIWTLGGMWLFQVLIFAHRDWPAH